ncbi:hypothetical protein [Desertibacillus haloalkaliphilus]|nr:hypothetical protein [Desertibacillus haloalkaliphilus]
MKSIEKKREVEKSRLDQVEKAFIRWSCFRKYEEDKMRKTK